MLRVVSEHIDAAGDKNTLSLYGLAARNIGISYLKGGHLTPALSALSYCEESARKSEVRGAVENCYFRVIEQYDLSEEANRQIAQQLHASVCLSEAGRGCLLFQHYFDKYLK